MKKTKNEKGITLVALIITIIVLLILAVVTINAVKGDGIIQKAASARDTYVAKADEEEQQLLEYEYEIGKIQGTVTGSFEEFLYNKAKKDAENAGTEIGTFEEYILEKYELKIGDYVAYEEGEGIAYTTDTEKGVGGYVDKSNSKLVAKTYTTAETGNLQWRVLGVNKNGQVELISDQATAETLKLYGKKGWQNSKGILNEFCDSLYGKGEFAEKARSLTVEDVNKFTTYNPSNYIDPNGNIKYGTKFSYKYDPDIEYVRAIISSNSSEDISKWKNTYLNSVSKEDWTVDKSNQGPCEVTIDLYTYKVEEYISNNAYKELLLPDTKEQYLASTCYAYCFECRYDNTEVRTLGGNGFVASVTHSSHSYWINQTGKDLGLYCRPVVVLQNGVSFSDSNNDNVFEINEKNN